jgi:hypothetical protein
MRAKRRRGECGREEESEEKRSDDDEHTTDVRYK